MRRRALGTVCVIALLLSLVPARAHALDGASDKIDPALLALMTANPAALQPVIVEMQPPPSTATGTPNLARASDALDLLRTYGRAVGGLAIIDSAAGFADANGINAAALSATDAITACFTMLFMTRSLWVNWFR